MIGSLHADQRGVTMVEMVVAGGLAALVTLVIAVLLLATTRTDVAADEESRALAELRVGVGRLVKEMREARIVYADSGPRRIRFWVDGDRDNQQEPHERVIWELRSDATGGRLVRLNDSSMVPQPVSDHVLMSDAFSYLPAPPSTTRVVITLSTDVRPSRRPTERTIRTEVRLRNAST